MRFCNCGKLLGSWLRERGLSMILLSGSAIARQLPRGRMSFMASLRVRKLDIQSHSLLVSFPDLFLRTRVQCGHGTKCMVKA